MRWPAAVVSVIVATLISGSNASATSEGSLPSGAGLLASLTSSQTALRSYAATLTVEFRERSFPFMHLRMAGDVYYRAPDRYAVVFKDAPAYMKGFAEGYATVMDPGSWNRYFSAAALPDRTVHGRVMRVLRLTGLDPKNQLHRGDIFVDPATGRISQMDWQMTNGMTFSVRQDYQQLRDGFEVVAAQHMAFRVPFARGDAVMALTNYRCNVDIADQMFAVAETTAR